MGSEGFRPAGNLTLSTIRGEYCMGIYVFRMKDIFKIKNSPNIVLPSKYHHFHSIGRAFGHPIASFFISQHIHGVQHHQTTCLIVKNVCFSVGYIIIKMANLLRSMCHIKIAQDTNKSLRWGLRMV